MNRKLDKESEFGIYLATLGIKLWSITETLDALSKEALANDIPVLSSILETRKKDLLYLFYDCRPCSHGRMMIEDCNDCCESDEDRKKEEGPYVDLSDVTSES